jgi:glycosyltransferase involved in cell wall biosynthesis
VTRRRVSLAPRYPDIPPVMDGRDRPFWSVMIPVYNCADYLRATLTSVLAQLSPEEGAQIEVIDDCSTKDHPEAVVREYGQGRVRYFRQPRNLGPQATFTTCIERSRGQWVHILHGDDMAGAGFYDAIQRMAAANPTVGAAFCRTVLVDATGVELHLSELESEETGIQTDLIDRLGVDNIIRFPSIAVRRQTYEKVGGFHPDLFHSADWDMWRRVALAVPVWYDPTPLAIYRVHEQSDTSGLIRTGANIADARHAIEIARTYLPRDRRADLTRRARRYHAGYALEIAEQMIERRAWPSALAQVREAFRCFPSPAVVSRAVRLAGRASYRLLANAGRS